MKKRIWLVPEGNFLRFAKRKFIALSSAPDIREVNFLAVILPEAKPPKRDFDFPMVTSRIDTPGWIGARIERSGSVDLGFFRTGDESPDIVDEFTTDAKILLHL